MIQLYLSQGEYYIHMLTSLYSLWRKEAPQQIDSVCWNNDGLRYSPFVQLQSVCIFLFVGQEEFGDPRSSASVCVCRHNRKGGTKNKIRILSYKTVKFYLNCALLKYKASPKISKIKQANRSQVV